MINFKNTDGFYKTKQQIEEEVRALEAERDEAGELIKDIEYKIDSNASELKNDIYAAKQIVKDIKAMLETQREASSLK